MSDLLKLAERVEADKWVEDDSWALYNILSKRQRNSTQKLMYQALKGSLDAAKALHDAVLPGWEWEMGRLSTWVYEVGNEPYIGKASNPAAAWVAAILRAKAQEG